MFLNKLSFGLITLLAVSLSLAAATAFAQAPQLTDAPLSPEAKVRITNLASNMANRTEATIQRFENITQRLHSRIAKMDAAGLDTSTEKFYLTESDKYLTSAQSQMENIDARIAAMVNASDYRTQWFALHDNFLEAQSMLVASRKLLSDTARDLELLSTGSNPAPQAAPNSN